MATRADGKVILLAVDREGAILELDNDPASGPLENIFTIKRDHSNYNALYSLALAAAANRWQVSVRKESDDLIDPKVRAFVKEIGVPWRADTP